MKSFISFIDEKVTQSQIDDLEKFADRILAKYDLDIEFSRHFIDRINDNRNDPDIAISELQKLFKKIQKHKGEEIKKMKGHEVVLKDLHKNLNLPVAVKYKNGEFEVVTKTIMRKADFKTSNKVIEY